MGFGRRHEPLDGSNVRKEYGKDGVPTRVIDFPGVGTYDVGTDARANSNPTWKFGSSIRKDVKRHDAPAPGEHDAVSYTTAGPRVGLQK